MRPAEDADLVFLLEQVLDAAIELQGADFGHVQLYDGKNGTLRLVAPRGVGKEFLEHFACVDANDTSACGTALKLGKRVIIEDVTKYAPYAPHLGVAERTGYKGVNCAPLTERGTGLPLGMLTTLFDEPYRPDEARLQLSDIFAAHAADLVSSHRAQQKLRESEEFFRLALEGGRMGSWEWDSETHLIKADAAHQALFGMPPQERPIPNEAYWDLMDPQEEEIGTKRAQDALDQGKDIELELRVYPPDGKSRWIAVRGRPREGGRRASLAPATTSRSERNARGCCANIRNGWRRFWNNFREASACSTRTASLSCEAGPLPGSGAMFCRRKTLPRARDGGPSMRAERRFHSMNTQALERSEGKPSVQGSTSCIPIRIEASIGTGSAQRRFATSWEQSRARPFSSRMSMRRSARTSVCGKARKG